MEMTKLQKKKLEEQKNKVIEWLNSRSIEDMPKYDTDILELDIECLYEHYIELGYFCCTNLAFYLVNEKWIKLLYPEYKIFVLDGVYYICFNEYSRKVLANVLQRRISEKLDYISDAFELIKTLSKPD